MIKKMFWVSLVIAGLSFGGCATYSTRNGVITPLGYLTPEKVNASRKVIAEYSIILGAFTSGYEDFLEKTKGQNIDIIDTNYFGYFRKIQAVKKE